MVFNYQLDIILMIVPLDVIYFFSASFKDLSSYFGSLYFHYDLLSAVVVLFILLEVC